ncbi:hypothetical protein [Paenibacillus taichungensis]|uniref:hypothetical protein n=1 Tax=Paenibacillus taichungensis TaxID=484184 RepID=UPI0035E39D1D
MTNSFEDTWEPIKKTVNLVSGILYRQNGGELSGTTPNLLNMDLAIDSATSSVTINMRSAILERIFPFGGGLEVKGGYLSGIEGTQLLSSFIL